MIEVKVIRYLNNLQKEPAYVEFILNGKNKILRYDNFLKKYKDEDETKSNGEQHINKT